MTTGRIAWLSPDDPPEAFPAVSAALKEPEGLLAAGGNLSSERLLYAYSRGIFPWYEDGQPLLWWSPDPRCVFLPGSFHVSRRLRREILRSTAEIRINSSFERVIRACAGPRRSGQGTWITREMIAAFETLHARRWAHSIEVWHDDELIGGVYGLVIGTVFFGESMFSRASNASKYALLFLMQMIDAGHLTLLDCQVTSEHLLRLGARMIVRSEFAKMLESGTKPEIPFENWPNDPIMCSQLLSE